MDARDWRLAGLAVALACLVFLTDLGGPSLWDRDEPRNAQCAREMMQRGDWVVPFFNDEMRDHKPALLYWLMMGSYALFGVNEFSARLPSALLAMVTVAATYSIGLRIWNARVAFWSSLALVSFALFALVGRAATPDAALIACSTLAVALFVQFSPDFDGKPGDATPFPVIWWQAAAIYAAMAAGVLAKGPVGLVMPTAVLGTYCLLRRLPRSQQDGSPSWSRHAMRIWHAVQPRHLWQTGWSMRPLLGLVVVLVLAGPWYAWVGYRTDNAWLVGFFGTHNFGRAVGTMEGHRGGFWFYPLVLLVGTFPWSVLTVPTVVTLVRQQPEPNSGQEAVSQRGLLLAVCWVATYLLVFTLAATKLPNYVAPAYPACGLLCGVIVTHWIQRQHRFADGWITGGMVTLLIVGVATTVGLYVALTQVAPSVRWLAGMGLVPTIAGGLGIGFDHLRRRQPVTWVLAAAAVAWVMGLVVLAPNRISALQQTDRYFAELGSMGQRLISVGPVEPSWVFYAGAPIQEFRRTDVRGVRRALRQKAPAVVVWTQPEDRSRIKAVDAVVEDLGTCSRLLSEQVVGALRVQTHALAQEANQTTR